jgi:hypothetical protein
MEPEESATPRPGSRGRIVGADHVRRAKAVLAVPKKDAHDKPGLHGRWALQSRAAALGGVDSRPLPERTHTTVERPAEVTV